MISWIKNYKQSSRKLTWKNVANFFGAKYRKINAAQDEENQFQWRLMRIAITSPACSTKGECVNCFCELNEKCWETMSCEHGCYPEWLTNAEWEVMKTFNQELQTEFINILNKRNND